MSESIADWERVRADFPVSASAHYLNNGTYGPVARPVLEALAGYVRDLEGCPWEGFGRANEGAVQAKRRLAAFAGAAPEDVVFVLNVTVGINMIARGLRGLKPGQAILSTDQEYGAVDNTWEFVARRRGLRVDRVTIKRPPASADEIVESFERAIRPETRVMAFSHITTHTGLILPLERLCALARQAGILTAVDGAHAPGMIDLDLAGSGVDFYTGNCHKWLCAPKGTGFLYAAPRAQDLLDPLIVGWGWNREKETYLGNLENPGTHSPCHFRAVGDAIAYQESVGRSRVSARGRELAAYLRRAMESVPGACPLTPDDPALACSLTAFGLAYSEGNRVGEAVRAKGIIVPIWMDPATRTGRIRVSTHIYNTTDEIDLLVRTMREAYA